MEKKHIPADGQFSKSEYSCDFGVLLLNSKSRYFHIGEN